MQILTHSGRAGQQFVPALQSQSLSFKFDALDIRVVIINDDPWFIAADVCAALDLDRTSTRKLDSDEKGVYSMQTPGGLQKVSVVSEAGLYTLVLRSRDAMKRGTVPYRFRKWVSSEVLPSIRKNGSYGTLPAIDVEHLMTQDLPLPVVKLPAEVEEAIERKAWDMAREAHRLSLRHLKGRVAYAAQGGWPRDRIDTNKALDAIEEGGLDYALTHVRRRAVTAIDAALKVKTSFVPEIADYIETLVKREVERSAAAEGGAA